MKRRLSVMMMVSGTIILLLSMILSTVSFAAPDLGRHRSAPSGVLAQANPCPPQSCDDGDPCTYDDSQEGTWVEAHCRDLGPGGIECTNKGLCEMAADASKNSCGSEWIDAQCEYGSCAGTPYDCDDGNVCTDDSCDGMGGCVNAPIAGCCTSDGDCDDGDICTDDTCVSNACQNVFDPTNDPSCQVGECTTGETRPCDTGLDGVCAAGTEACVDGYWSGECEQDTDSSPEVCDGLDNDCDGEVDEGGVCDQPQCEDGETRPCDTGLDGVCAAGTEACVDGYWSGECEQDTASSPEVCDGLDNDCDDDVDEGLGSTTCGVGACQVTVQNCVDGVPQACVPGDPSDEICGDGIDNDCDGKIDEGCACDPGEEQACYPGPAGTEDVGLCKAGIQTCDDEGQWGECVGAVVPTDEICDDLDNDCDGKIDEGGVCGKDEPTTPEKPSATTPEETPTTPPAEPTPTVVVEVLAVEELPETGIPPVAPLLPTLPMTLSALALILGGLILREIDKN